MSGPNLEDYIDVATRIANFYAKFPEGSLQAEVYDLSDSRVVMRAFAYRTPDDPRPGVGHSMLGIPGTTNFTRGSEIENAETSAVGRAIGMLGFDVKKGIASREEIRNKQHDPAPRRAPAGNSSPAGAAEGSWDGTYATTDSADGTLRQEATRGNVLKFVIVNPDPSPGYKRLNVRVFGDLAVAVNTALQAFGKPDDVTVYGTTSLESFEKDGRTLKYAVCEATRILTPDWVVPAPDARPASPRPTSVEKVANLDELPF